jgi:sulfatase modifying factor 1
MHRRDILLGSLGLALSGTASANAIAQQAGQKRFAKGLAGYRALNAYVKSLRPIPAGTFQMGSTTGDSDEKPVHSVTLSAFRMGATPVTVAVWKEYCALTGTKLPEAPAWGLLDDHPVVNVSWNEIMGTNGKGGFCAWASDIAGFRLMLPTEAQFEYASRGGQSGLEYPGGNSFDRSKLLWSSGNDSGDAGNTAPGVRTSNIFRNAYGLSDMSGNIWQWCSDYYSLYSTSSQTDPTCPSSTSDNVRCVRVGAWLAEWNKEYRDPSWRGSFTGFRLSAGPG